MTDAPNTVGPAPATGTLGVGWADGGTTAIVPGVGVGVAATTI